MAEKDKKFYWIKLRQSLLTSEKVDFLMSQKNGAYYVVLYQCLCLKTINSAGELANKIGELIMECNLVNGIYKLENKKHEFKSQNKSK